MGRPKLADETRMVSVRLDADMVDRLARLQPRLAPPVDLTLSQVIRAVLDQGLENIEATERGVR